MINLDIIIHCQKHIPKFCTLFLGVSPGYDTWVSKSCEKEKSETCQHRDAVKCVDQ
jgi:hypothetical protein